MVIFVGLTAGCFLRGMLGSEKRSNVTAILWQILQNAAIAQYRRVGLQLLVDMIVDSSKTYCSDGLDFAKTTIAREELSTAREPTEILVAKLDHRHI